MALRKTQNVITHVTQPGTGGTGAAHNAEDIAFDDTVADLGEDTVQAAVEAVVASVAELTATAADVSFDDDTAELGATTVQEAIDALAAAVAALTPPEEI
jgi:hypothetical protein